MLRILPNHIYKFKQNNSIFICTRKIIKDVPRTTLENNHITLELLARRRRETRQTENLPQAENLIILRKL